MQEEKPGLSAVADPDMDDADRQAAAEFNQTPDREMGEHVGRSLEDLTDSVEDEEGQQLLDFGDQVNLSVKGKKPTDSELKVKAISRPIKGQLGDKSGDDETLHVLLSGTLDEIVLKTKRDGDGRPASKLRRHVVTPIAMAHVPGDCAPAIKALLEGDHDGAVAAIRELQQAAS